MTLFNLPPLPLRDGSIIPLAELPQDGTIVPAEIDQRIARKLTYSLVEIPTTAELDAMTEVHQAALDENTRRRAGAMGIKAA